MGVIAAILESGELERLSTGLSLLVSAAADGEEARALVTFGALGPLLADDLAGRGVQAPAGADDPETVDLTRSLAGVVESPAALDDLSEQDAGRWRALALTVTCADLVGAARGAHALACEYAKVREQYGATIGSYQAVGHLLAESLALIEGSISVLRHAAWAVDELPAAEAIDAARVAKIYCARAALTVCETSIQVHGGIGNTWECLAHIYLRRVLAATEAWPVKLEELTIGFP